MTLISRNLKKKLICNGGFKRELRNYCSDFGKAKLFCLFFSLRR